MNSTTKLIIAAATLSTLLGCEKAKQTAESMKNIDSPWTLKEAKDPMTDAVVITAESQQRSEEHPLVAIATKISCVPADGPIGFQIEITSLSTKKSEDGVLSGMPIEFNETPQNLRGLVRLQLVSSGLIPAEFPYERTTTVAIRLNEGLPDNQLVPDVPAVSTQYNNEIFIFPFQLEAALKTNIKSARIMIPTKQGTPNVWIDFRDPNVSKVVKSCENIKLSLNSKIKATEEPAAKEAENNIAQASAPEIPSSESKAAAESVESKPVDTTHGNEIIERNN